MYRLFKEGRPGAYPTVFAVVFLCTVSAFAQRRGAQAPDADQFRFRFVGPLAGEC